MKVHSATKSHVPAPIVLEILDHDDKQLSAKVKQQHAELKLKKAMDALECMHKLKKKAAEKAVECKCEKKAECEKKLVCEIDEMASLERMREHCKHDTCCGPSQGDTCQVHPTITNPPRYS